jgi:hypothetical protein
MTKRWSPRPETTAEDEARADALLKQAVVRQALDARALEEIRRRLPGQADQRPRGLVLRVGVALALFLAGGGVFASATMLGHWRSFSPAPASAPPVPEAIEPARRHAARHPAPAETTAPAAAVAPPAPAEIAPPGTVAEALQDHAPARRPREARPVEAPSIEPAPAAAPALAPSAIAEEAALVSNALRQLRERGDAAGALSLLDERDRRFGAAGLLGEETRTTRVEALLRLGEHARALALLDGVALPPAGRGRALLATRAELRAEAGRCHEADADFDALLADGAAPADVAERALYGRAACRARLGAADAARADLELYLQRFPAGRNAARARAALNP